MPDPNLTLEDIIRSLDLQPLPVEGGLFRQVYRSAESIPAEALPVRYSAARSLAEEKPFYTAIFYLLTADPGSFSALHRLPTDEVWHFYLGDPVEMTLLFADGSSRQVVLGQDLLNGQQVQFNAPGGVWQGTRLIPGGHYALLGTTMAPGYTQSDFELGSRTELLSQYPQEKERILALTRE